MEMTYLEGIVGILLSRSLSLQPKQGVLPQPSLVLPHLVFVPLDASI